MNLLLFVMGQAMSFTMQQKNMRSAAKSVRSDIENNMFCTISTLTVVIVMIQYVKFFLQAV
jgi:hypothetical protein